MIEFFAVIHKIGCWVSNGMTLKMKSTGGRRNEENVKKIHFHPDQQDDKHLGIVSEFLDARNFLNEICKKRCGFGSFLRFNP